MSILGFPFADEKRQAPAGQGGFRGMVHDLSIVHHDDVIPLWIRPRLRGKILEFISTARRDSMGSSDLVQQQSCTDVSRSSIKLLSARLREQGLMLSKIGSTLALFSLSQLRSGELLTSSRMCSTSIPCRRQIQLSSCQPSIFVV